MEWILQVVDEFDDVLGALRHRWLGFHAEIAALLFAGIGVGAMLAAFALGADPLMVGTAAIVLNLAALLRIRESRTALRA